MSSVAIGEEAPFGNAALIIYRYLLILAAPDFTGRLIGYLEQLTVVCRESESRGWIQWREVRFRRRFRDALEAILKALLAGVHACAILGKALAVGRFFVVLVRERARGAVPRAQATPGAHALARRPRNALVIYVRKHRFRTHSHGFVPILHPAIWALAQALAESIRRVLPPEIARAYAFHHFFGVTR